MIRKKSSKKNSEKTLKPAKGAVVNDFLSAKEEVFANAVEAVLALGGSEIHCEPHGQKLLIRWRSANKLRELTYLDGVQAGLFLKQLHAFTGLAVDWVVPFRERQVVVSLAGQQWQLYVSLLMTAEGGRYFLRLIKPQEYILSGLGFLDIQAGTFLALSSAKQGLLAVGALRSANRQALIKALAAGLLSKQDRAALIADQPLADWLKAESFKVRPEIGFNLSVAVRAAAQSDFKLLLIDAQIRPADFEAIAEALELGIKVILALPVDSSAKLFQYLWHLSADKELLRHRLLGLIVRKNLPQLCATCRQSKTLSVQGQVVLSKLLSNLPANKLSKFLASPGSKGRAYAKGQGCEDCQAGINLPEMPVYEAVRFKSIKAWPDGNFNFYELTDRRGLISLRQAAVIKALMGGVDLEQALSF